MTSMCDLDISPIIPALLNTSSVLDTVTGCSPERAPISFWVMLLTCRSGGLCSCVVILLMTLHRRDTLEWKHMLNARRLKRLVVFAMDLESSIISAGLSRMKLSSSRGTSNTAREHGIGASSLSKWLPPVNAALPFAKAFLPTRNVSFSSPIFERQKRWHSRRGRGSVRFP